MRLLITVVVLTMASPAFAQQQPPPIRQIGQLERLTPDSIVLASITTALSMPGGRVMINDTRGRRVLLLDSSLARPTVVADTTSATANAYGSSWATLIRYRGDSALLMVPSTLSMFVIAPNGTTARTMAFPRPNEAQQLAGTWGVPGFDSRGRLVYFGGQGVLPGILMLGPHQQLLENGQPTNVTRMLIEHSGGMFKLGTMLIDSSFVARIDLGTRVLDTVAWVRIPRFQRAVNVDAAGQLTNITTTPDPLPLIDQWTVLRDGTIAVVRGRDYHVDWIGADGRMSSSAKIPFEWRRVDDAAKQVLIDSAVAHWQHEFDAVGARRSARGPIELAPLIAARAPLTEVPDYFPPFGEQAVTSDADGNLWIRTTQLVDNRPVYDVVNRRGELIDRVQLPSHRTVVGFGPGVVYMAVIDAAGKVRLERARLK